MHIFSDSKSQYPPGRFKRESAYNSFLFYTFKYNSALLCSTVVFHHKITKKIINKNLFSHMRLVKSQQESSDRRSTICKVMEDENK